MFSPDIINFRQFYASPFGVAMFRAIMAGVYKLWPYMNGDSVLGIGYASPYMEAYLEDAELAVVCMPAHQGAAYWPVGAANRVFLAHESALPLRENIFNRVLMIHSVENSEQLSWMMQEAWRVLTPGGRLLIVVPNRLGLWSHFSNNPFGFGRPFSKAQVKELMTEHGFTPMRSESALFMLPVNYPFFYRLAPGLERVGEWLFPLMGGVLLVEAEKQIYASIQQSAAVRIGHHMPVRATKPAMGLKKR